MNILYINHYAGSPEMGMEFRPYYLAREWIKMGHNVTIVAADFSHLRVKNPDVSNDFKLQKNDDIQYLWIKTGQYKGNGFARAFTMAQFVFKLLLKSKWIASKFSPDVVICSSTYPIDTFVGQKICRVSAKKVKLVHEVHDLWPSTLTEVGEMTKFNPFVLIMQIGENSAYRHSDKVVSLAPLALPYMMQHGLKKDKFIHIPNGVAEEEWKNSVNIPIQIEKKLLRLKENNFIVGYVGGHSISNSLDDIIDVADRMRNQNVKFVLVGDGIEKKRLMNTATSMNLKNIIFLPPVEKRMIPSLLKFFDCGFISAVPSPLYRFGTCMNKIFDYMAAGLPIICAITTPQSQVSEAKCGICLESGDIEGIVNSISQLSNKDNQDLKIFSQRGKEAVKNFYTYDKLAKQFLDSI